MLALASLALTAGACNGPGVGDTTAGTPSTRETSGDAGRLAGGSTTRPSAPDAAYLRQTLIYLADDAREGRGIGTAGLAEAARFISSEFADAGLEPLPGLDGFAQRFDVRVANRLGDATQVTVSGKPLEIGTAATALSLSGNGRFDAGVVFVGYGVASEEHNYNDYAGLDVRGKAVLMLRYEPHNAQGRSRFAEGDDASPRAALISKARLAEAQGAAAMVLVNPPMHRGKDELIAFDRALGGEVGIPVLQVTQAVADQILAAGGSANLETLQREIDSQGKPASRALGGVNIAGNVEILRQRSPVENVVAMVRGSGPLADEYIVVGAHYDHLGFGGQGSLAQTRGEIHNGADDNASGTSAMLALARRFADNPPGGRSLIFVAFTAEETGLIGSQRFVDQPPVPLEKIAYMVNLDMVGRIRNQTLLVGGMGTAPTLEQAVARADEASPLRVSDNGKGGMGPSDHMSFALRKIPVLFLFSGLHEDYHRPSDDPERINFAGLEAVVDFTEVLVRDLADERRELYVSTFDQNMHAMMGTGGGIRVQLGVMPVYGSDVAGLPISGTRADSPAARAGLREGDVLIEMAGKPIRNINDLTAILGEAKPGDEVTIRFNRGGQVMDTRATLTAR